MYGQNGFCVDYVPAIGIVQVQSMSFEFWLDAIETWCLAVYRKDNF